MEKKKEKKKISSASIRRISFYYRTLCLLERKGVKNVTSIDLAEIGGRYSAIVRKDLSSFGYFGVRGVGYDVVKLKHELANILGLNKKWNLVVIGSRPYSEVLINSESLRESNFIIKKIYEKSPDDIKKNTNDIKVLDIDQMEDTLDPQEDGIVIIALPPPEVQAVIDRLGKIGMKGVLYLASRSVKVPENMIVINQDITIELGMLTYRLNEKEKKRIKISST
jgi:redox-sensing transcriptional repressor